MHIAPQAHSARVVSPNWNSHRSDPFPRIALRLTSRPHYCEPKGSASYRLSNVEGDEAKRGNMYSSLATILVDNVQQATSSLEFEGRVQFPAP